MKYFIISLKIVLTMFISYGQTFIGTENVLLNDNLGDRIRAEYQYLNPEFIPGFVLRNDGTRGRGSLNYNILLDEIHFISQDSAILALADPSSINFVSFGNSLFTYDVKRGYLEVVFNGNLKVLLKRSLLVKESSKEQSGAYGISSQSSSSQKLHFMDLGYSIPFFDVKSFNEPIEAELYFNQTVYLLYKNRIHPNSRRSFNRIVGRKNRSTLDKYINENTPDFNNLQEIIELSRFVNEIIRD